MKSFHFRLERVLAWRRTQSEQCELAIRQLIARIEELNAALARLRASRVSAENAVLRSGLVGAGDLAALGSFRVRLRRQEKQLLDLGQNLHRQLVQKRRDWLEADRRCRLLEKLKSRCQAAHAYQADRELEAFASEAYLAQWTTRDRR